MRMIAALAGGIASAVTAQSTAPSTTAISLPNIAQDSRPLGDERKFFVFHQQGVTFEQAGADLRYCFRYTRTGSGLLMPYFFPFDGRPGAGPPTTYDGGQFGLTGAVIGAIIAGPLERSKRQINLMRCMLPRGYARYRVSEGLWKELNGKDAAADLYVQARIASGPVPATPRVLP